MEQNSMQGMWGRYFLFILLSIAVLVGHSFWMARNAPKRQPAAEAPVPVAQGVGGANDEGQPAKVPPGAADKPAEAPKPAEKLLVVKEPKHPDAYVTLGSLDPSSPYRMLVTVTARGAAVARVELGGERFRDVEDRSGYLGQIVVDENVRGTGCPVQVVGSGTPAAAAGLRPGDVITAVDDVRVTGWETLKGALAKTRPGQTIALTLEGRPEPVAATLSRRPLEVIRPEAGDPLSFLLTLRQIDDLKLEAPPLDPNQEQARPPALNQEIEGLDLRSGNWKIVAHDEEQVTLRRRLPTWGLEIDKVFRLAKVPEQDQADPNYPAYHLTFEVAIRNTGGEARKVAYQLDGPTGLPTEGWWYASKVSHYWFKGVGLRDVIASFGPPEPNVYSAVEIAHGEWRKPIRTDDQKGDLAFVGVDAQYFSAVMIPQRQAAGQCRFAEWQPMAVGEAPKDVPTKTNTSFRLSSVARDVKPQATWVDSFQVFAGPKKPDLLDAYGLKGILYYGYFWWSAKPMLWLLHFFHDYLVFNYGLAIIMLTVVVRGCMFPLSKKQAIGAQKMQEIQPELKRLKEKYKNDLQAMGRAQRELFAKYNYNPWGGCLIVFLQLPIFVGLYRALMVDVELRGAALVSQSIRWASNLAAPDMLLDWSGFMPGFVTRGIGFFGLGPYFNLLPIITVVLFLWQQKKFMPPPADEQAALNMKIMQYMMVFMGVLFYKVASGLCLYFIASSLWSIAERKYLPKTASSPESPPLADKPRDNPILARLIKPDGAPAKEAKRRRSRRRR